MEEYEIYGGFAYVYDRFMNNIPYEEWHEYLSELLREQGVMSGILVELGCGTGTMTSMLAHDGYDMIGIDLSEEMLDVARSKCPDEVLLLKQDMRKLDLYGSAAAFVCVCDGMNYILTEDDLVNVFKGVYTFLDEGGVFIFDMKTEHFYRDELGQRTIAENLEDASFIWENEYDEQTKINSYLLTVYQVADDENDLFERSDELHRQRAYSVAEVKSLAEKAGLRYINVYNAFTRNEPDEKSERIYFIFQK